MKERGLFELYQDPERGDATLLSSNSPFASRWSRRHLLRAGNVVVLERLLKMAVPFARLLPVGIAPVALGQTDAGGIIATKPGLRVLNDRPLNAETPAHLLDDDVTPASRLFVRNNGIPPALTDAGGWQISIGGEACLEPQTFDIASLKRDFDVFTYQLQLECGGNGRSEFRPRASGNQWTTGAVGCPSWTGVRLKDVLGHCGIGDDAMYVAFKSADSHASGDPNKEVISRGVPLAKALEDESLIAFQMNGADIPLLHGAPVRLVCGGWPGSVSGKWLRELLIRDRIHDGAKMTGTSYRVPCRPVAPGSKVEDADMCIIESMPVKSLITSPQSGSTARAGQTFEIRGHAWAGDLAVNAVDVSIDFGSTWQQAAVEPPANRLAWQRWRTTVTLPARGYFEIWARARDNTGRQQPMLVPGWNPKGYLNNASHRIAVQAT